MEDTRDPDRTDDLGAKVEQFRSSGRPELLEEAWSQVAPRLFQRALRRKRSRGEALDLVQDTFVVALGKLDTFDERRALEPWLHGILENLAARRRLTASAVPDLDPMDSAAVTPDDEVELREARALVREQVATLAHPYKEALELYLFEHLDGPEIAARLDRPASTVRTQLERGLARLREKLPRDLAPVLVGILAATWADGRSGGGLAGAARLAPRALLGAAGLLLIALAALLWRGLEREPDGLAPPTAESELTAAREPDPDRAREREVADSGAPFTDPATPQAVRSVRATWDETGEPAAGVALVVVSPFVPGTSAIRDELLHRSVVFTDESGVARLPRLTPGPAQIRLEDAAPFHDFEVPATGPLELSLELPTGRRLFGRITRADGSPVVGARVFASGSDGVRAPGYLFARTGEDGRFDGTIFVNRVRVWVRATGLRPAPIWTELESLPEVCRNVVLHGDARTVSGRVVNDLGEPVEHAFVGCYVLRDAEGAPLPSPSWVLSDADGRFRFEDQEHGPYLVAATSPEHGWARVEHDPTADGRSLELRLQQGTRVFGRVHGLSEGTYPDLRVATRFHTQRPMPEEYLLMSASVISERGEYELPQCPPGTLDVALLDAKSGRPVEIRRVETGGAREVRFDFWKRASSRWEVRVSRDGRPVAGQRVVVTTPSSRRRVMGFNREGTTDSQGRVVFEDPPRAPAAVEAITDGLAPWTLAAHEVLQDGDRTIELDLAAEHELGSIAGRVRTPALQGDADFRLRLRQLPVGWPQAVAVSAAEPEFAFDSLPAGRYSLELRLPESEAYAPLRRVTLAPGERRELGDLFLPELGRLRLAKSSTRTNMLRLVFVTSSLTTEPMRIDAAEDWSLAFPAGPVEVRYRDVHGAPRQVSLELEPGRELELSLDRGRGVLTTLEFTFDHLATTETNPTRLILELTNLATGDSLERSFPLEPEGLYRFPLELAPGRWRVNASSEWGGFLDTELELPDQDEPLSITLPLDAR